MIEEFEINDGKSEFYKGILLIELDSVEKGCDYIIKSADLGFGDDSFEITFGFMVYSCMVSSWCVYIYIYMYIQITISSTHW